jgi:tetrahydromethanopterin S-methyltransferase subunit F
MSFLNRGIQATQMIGIISLVFSGLVLIPLPAFAFASQPQLMAQVTPTPDSAMTPVNGKVNVRFINETGADIEYQVVGDTEYRTLAGDAEMTLRDLPVSTSLTFRRKDSGLLRVQFRVDDPIGTIVVNVSATTDFALDRTTLYIDQKGMIFFN